MPLRVLGIGDYLSLGDLYWRLAKRGHDVRVWVDKAEGHGLFEGMVTRSTGWRADLDWIRAAGDDGLVVFETADRGEWQDQLREDGFRVFGGSAWGDRLENDRAYGQQVLRDAGMQTAAAHAFDDFDAALAFLDRQPGRYVLKFSDSTLASMHSYVGEMERGEDLAAVLHLEKARWKQASPPAFILMEHVAGIEMGVGAFFNGERFLGPAVLDWEHKRFFPGDLGEMTGEMGTIVTYRGTRRFFERTLAPLTERLHAGGYCGYINLNTIVNEHGIWPLEFTSRFGYPGYAICDALHVDGWDDLFLKVLGRHERRFATRDGFAAGVVLTVPPFPYERDYASLSKGVPILYREPLTSQEEDRLHHGEVTMEGSQLVTSGSIGYITVATGVGPDIATARREAYDLARKVVVPKVRYRVDIGERLMRHDHEVLARWGHF